MQLKLHLAAYGQAHAHKLHKGNRFCPLTSHGMWNRRLALDNRRPHGISQHFGGPSTWERVGGSNTDSQQSRFVELNM